MTNQEKINEIVNVLNSKDSSITNITGNQIANKINDLTVVNNILPLGSILIWSSSSSIPTGFKECIGQTLYRSSGYGSFIDYVYSTTASSIKLPDLRECVPVCAGETNSRFTFRNNDVFNINTYNDSRIRSHKHSFLSFSSGRSNNAGWDGGNSTADWVQYSSGELDNNKYSNYSGGDITTGKCIAYKYIIYVGK